MTFLDAAIEVLRQATEPLHFGDITKRAVEQKLLSHVGRDPEAAMQTCLNSAVRRGRTEGEAVVIRSRPGFYALSTTGTAVKSGSGPAETRTPPAKEITKDDEEIVRNEKPVSRSSAPPSSPRITRGGRPPADPAAAPEEAASDGAFDEPSDVRGGGEARHGRGPSRRLGRGRGGGRDTERPSPSGAELHAGAMPSGRPAAAGLGGVEPRSQGSDAEGAEPRRTRPVEFEAPSEAGLEGVTDVAVVMANAMSRLVEERPELRGEFEALQQAPGPAAVSEPVAPRRFERGSLPGRAVPVPAADDRGSRRRRRRRRRGRRTEWGAAPGSGEDGRALSSAGLLDQVVEVLREAGSRSLHVRQLAESLASRGVLGGEVSEIERAVTTLVLLDIREHGRASRFEARGDARYQLQGVRLPESAARAEQTLREAAAAVERESAQAMERWLGSLGARALETILRMFLQEQGFSIVTTLPPVRGVGRLVVRDPEAEDEDGRLLVLVAPRRTALDLRGWEGDLERHGCSGLFVASAAEAPPDGPCARAVGVGELAEWLRTAKLGLVTVRLEVTVLDPAFLESISGLDT